MDKPRKIAAMDGCSTVSSTYSFVSGLDFFLNVASELGCTRSAKYSIVDHHFCLLSPMLVSYVLFPVQLLVVTSL